MRTHSNAFKETIKELGRQINGKVYYYPNYNLITESEDAILTENDIELVSEQFDKDNAIEIDSELIYSMELIKNGQLLQSLMKELDIELKYELNIGSVVNAKFGLKISNYIQTTDATYQNDKNYYILENDIYILLIKGVDYQVGNNITGTKYNLDEEYEYLDYGNYIVYSKEFNLDTETWNYVCYDMMLYSMIKYIPMSSVTYPITIRDFISAIANKMGIGFANSSDTFVNYDQLINKELFENKGYTYRDILDKLSQITASNILINDNDELEISYVNKIKNNNSVTSNQSINIEAVEEPISNLQIKGDTIQNGTPTPTSPVTVQTVTGNQTVNVTGKNLLPYTLEILKTLNTSGTWSGNVYTRNNVVFTINEDLSIYISGTATANTYLDLTGEIICNSGKYTFSGTPSTGSSSTYRMQLVGTASKYDNGSSNTFQLTEKTTYSKARIYVANNVNPNGVTFKPMLEIGNIATIYETPQFVSYTISLGNIELCKISDYQDYIYKNGDNWYKHSEIGKYVYNNDITSNAITNNFVQTLTPVLNIGTNISRPNLKKITICNMITDSGGYDCLAGTTAGGKIRVQISTNYVSSYAEAYSLFAQNNLTIYYVLGNYSETQITDTSLISQLETLASATLYNGTNNIVMSGGLNPYLKFDYVKNYEILNEEYLKDINVAFGKNFGPINKISIIDTDNSLQYYVEDSTSILQNEMTQVNITDNELAFNGEEQTIADNILTKLNGLYYSINDFETTGVCYYDFLDLFYIEAKGNKYQCLLLNNEISITQGIKEDIFTEELEETETSSHNYETPIMSDKQVQFKINQQEGKIESKVEKDGVISAINQSAEEIKIQASKLSFEGATIDMTADNIKIQGENLDIDSKGTIILTDNSVDATLSGAKQEVAYIVESEGTASPSGTTVNLEMLNKVLASGIDTKVNASYEYSGTITNYTNGIQTATFSQPRINLYSKTDELNRSDLDISLDAGISYSTTNNGTVSIPLTITSAGRITCVSVTQTSKKENKKNFEKLTNAKEILNNTDIYKYNMTDEEDGTKKHIGFVIGEDFNYSEDITSIENNGADIYSMVSVLWQVVKEQQEEINELKEVIRNG